MTANDSFSPMILLVACLFVTLGIETRAADPEADAVRLNGDSAPFAYNAYAAIPTPESQLAAIISVDYRRAPDEFTAQELLSKIRPVIETRVEESKAVEHWRVVIDSRLAQFDFQRGGFPTGMNSDTFVPFGNFYAVTFSNISDFSLVPVPVEEAKKLAEALRRDRRVVVEILGQVEGAEEKTINYHRRKVLNFKIDSVTINLRDGRKVGTATGGQNP